MKLLLTSAGFTNNKIAQGLIDLVQKPFSELKLAFIPTAANVEPGGKEWFCDYDAEFYDEAKGPRYDCLNYVNFYIFPHLNSPDFPKVNIKDIERFKKRVGIINDMYALDDNSAVKVDEDKIEAISTGDWKKI